MYVQFLQRTLALFLFVLYFVQNFFFFFIVPVFCFTSFDFFFSFFCFAYVLSSRTTTSLFFVTIFFVYIIFLNFAISYRIEIFVYTTIFLVWFVPVRSARLNERIPPSRPNIKFFAAHEIRRANLNLIRNFPLRLSLFYLSYQICLRIVSIYLKISILYQVFIARCLFFCCCIYNNVIRVKILVFTYPRFNLAPFSIPKAKWRLFL